MFKPDVPSPFRVLCQSFPLLSNDVEEEEFGFLRQLECRDQAGVVEPELGVRQQKSGQILRVCDLQLEFLWSFFAELRTEFVIFYSG